MTVDVVAHYFWGLILFLFAAIAILETHKLLPGWFSRALIGVVAIGGGLGYNRILFGSYDLFFTGFFNLDASSQQHTLINILSLGAGVALVALANRKRSHLAIRLVALLAVGVILFMHSQPGGHTHAAWLVPYHQTMAILLGIAAVGYGLIIKQHTYARQALFVIPLCFMAVAAMLLFYTDPGGHGASASGKVEAKCDTIKRVVEVTIQQRAFAPSTIKANKCDVLEVSTIVGERHKVAFGNHSGHETYDGYEEQDIDGDNKVRIILTKSGTYNLHDHYDDDINASLQVAD